MSCCSLDSHEIKCGQTWWSHFSRVYGSHSLLTVSYGWSTTICSLNFEEEDRVENKQETSVYSWCAPTSTTHFRFRVLLTLSSSDSPNQMVLPKKCIYIYLITSTPNIISMPRQQFKSSSLPIWSTIKPGSFIFWKGTSTSLPTICGGLSAQMDLSDDLPQMIWILSVIPFTCVSLIFCYPFTDVLCFYRIDCHALAVFLPPLSGLEF